MAKEPRFATVIVHFPLEIAHHLENVPIEHKCRREHGHSYRVGVELTGAIDARTGWVIDYALIAQAWKERVHEVLDHRDLNKVPALAHLNGNTTSEELAFWIRDELARALEMPSGNLVVMVEETKDFGARTVSFE